MYSLLFLVCFGLKWVFKAARSGIIAMVKIMFVTSRKEDVRNVNRV